MIIHSDFTYHLSLCSDRVVALQSANGNDTRRDYDHFQLEYNKLVLLRMRETSVTVVAVTAARTVTTWAVL